MALEVVTEEIAQNLEEAAELTRKVNSGGTKFFLGGVLVGAAVGFYIGYRFNREKIRAVVIKEAEHEIDMMRAYYQSKTVAAEEKPSVEQIIEEKGYSTKEKSTPKAGVRSRGKVAPKRPLPPPVPVTEPSVVKHSEWNYAKELEARSPTHPYIIHQDEFREGERGYEQATYTYYAEDGVLCDSDDRPIPNGIEVAGNLNFGHGSNDENIVYVRNDVIEVDMEISRSPKSYEQEVLGLDGSGSN